MSSEDSRSTQMLHFTLCMKDARLVGGYGIGEDTQSKIQCHGVLHISALYAYAQVCPPV